MTVLIEHLRKELKGWTWLDVCKSTGAPKEGVWFYGRIGLFLNRPCLAVCGLNSFVVLRYVDKHKVSFNREDKPIDAGNFKSGRTLFLEDLLSLGIDPHQPVLTTED